MLTLDSQNTTYHKDLQIRPCRTRPESLRDLLQIVVDVPGLMDRALVRRCQGGGGQEEGLVHPEDTKPKRGRGPPFGLYPGPGKGPDPPWTQDSSSIYWAPTKEAKGKKDSQQERWSRRWGHRYWDYDSMFTNIKYMQWKKNCTLLVSVIFRKMSHQTKTFVFL